MEIATGLLVFAACLISATSGMFSYNIVLALRARDPGPAWWIEVNAAFVVTSALLSLILAWLHFADIMVITLPFTAFAVVAMGINWLHGRASRVKARKKERVSPRVGLIAR